MNLNQRKTCHTHRKFWNQKSNGSRPDIDNVFVDNNRPDLLSTASIRSGLSDNDAEILTIRNIQGVPGGMDKTSGECSLC